MRPIWTSALLPLSILGLGMGLSVATADFAREETEHIARLRLEAMGANAAQAVERRFASYVEILRGLRALFNTGVPVAREQFQRYAQALDIQRTFPGFQVLNYAPYVSAEDRSAFEAQMRRELPAFRITPAGKRAGYYPLTYLEPMQGNENVLGKDMGAIPFALKALEQARDSGALTSSGRMIQTQGNDAHVGLAMRLPVYRAGQPTDTPEQRRAAYMGSVGAGVRISKLMQGLHPDGDVLRVKLYDGGPAGQEASEMQSREAAMLRRSADTLLFDSEAGRPVRVASPSSSLQRGDEAVMEHLQVFRLGQRIWLVEASAPPERLVGRLDTLMPLIILLGGTVISALLAGIVFSLSTSRARAISMASGMTRSLRLSERRLAEAQNLAMLGSWVLPAGRQELQCTDEAKRIYGFHGGAGDCTVQALLERVPDGERAQVERMLREARSSQRRYELDHRLLLPDGGERWVHVVLQTVHEDGHSVLSGTVRDDTVRKQAERELQHMATHDGLTGLPNRFLLHERLAHAIKRGARNGKRLAVLFLDLDRFKYINDTLGHSAGDILLRSCAARLTASVRQSDTVARFGGDEFVVVVEDLESPTDVVEVVHKLLKGCAEPVDVEGRELHVSTSVGISVYPDDGQDAEALIKDADAAMYLAKERGRGTYHFYSAQMNTQGQERFLIEVDLRRALERGELFLVYQPKMDLRTRSISGVEALMRWRHPTLDMVSPSQFIPIAEETGLIESLGGWALETACQQARAWSDAGLAVQISVNLSPRQLKRPDLAKEVSRVLCDTGLTPHLLELEITESSMMHNAEGAIEQLQQLRSLGVSLAIDDFGTGYSSLSHLKRFPISTLKIDRSFIKELPSDSDASGLMAAIIGLAHGLRMQVVAEGVETAEQLDCLSASRCDAIQGYLVSKPITAERMEALLARGPRNLVVPAVVA